jgi:hypothetical protein
MMLGIIKIGHLGAKIMLIYANDGLMTTSTHHCGAPTNRITNTPPCIMSTVIHKTLDVESIVKIITAEPELPAVPWCSLPYVPWCGYPVNTKKKH